MALKRRFPYDGKRVSLEFEPISISVEETWTTDNEGPYRYFTLSIADDHFRVDAPINGYQWDVLNDWVQKRMTVRPNE